MNFELGARSILDKVSFASNLLRGRRDFTRNGSCCSPSHWQNGRVSRLWQVLKSHLFCRRAHSYERTHWVTILGTWVMGLGEVKPRRNEETSGSLVDWEVSWFMGSCDAFIPGLGNVCLTGDDVILQKRPWWPAVLSHRSHSFAPQLSVSRNKMHKDEAHSGSMPL